MRRWRPAPGRRPEDWFPVFKARYGMQVAFDAVRSVRGDGSVLTQLFTCCTAVDPIVVSGLRPRYADVGADTMGIDVAKVESMPLGSDEQVHAMVMQHTFGAIDEDSSRRLAALAGEMGALLVEDCAHCVTRMARDAAGWPLADISVHSFGVEKMLPTRFGGAIWVNPRLRERDAALDAETRGRLAALEQPSHHLDTVTKLYINENRVLSRLGGFGGRMRERLTASGWYEPPISDKERRGALEYEPMTVTPWIAQQAVAGISALDANENGRRAVVTMYREAFAGVDGLDVPGSGDGRRGAAAVAVPAVRAGYRGGGAHHRRSAAGGWLRRTLVPPRTVPRRDRSGRLWARHVGSLHRAGQRPSGLHRAMPAHRTG